MEDIRDLTHWEVAGFEGCSLIQPIHKLNLRESLFLDEHPEKTVILCAIRTQALKHSFTYQMPST